MTRMINLIGTISKSNLENHAMKRTLMAVSVIALFATAAFAADTVPQKVVSFGDLNLSTQEGVSTLQQRLLAAAAEVCSATTTTAQGKIHTAFEACKKKAVKNAVADVTSNLAFRLSAIQ